MAERYVRDMEKGIMKIKYRITKMDKDMFFLRVGDVVIVDYIEETVYSEDMKQ